MTSDHLLVLRDHLVEADALRRLDLAVQLAVSSLGRKPFGTSVNR